MVKKESKDSGISEILLLVWALIQCVTWGITELMPPYMLEGFWRTFYYLIMVIRIVSNILPAIAIKNNTFKIVAIVLTTIVTVFSIYRIIHYIFFF